MKWIKYLLQIFFLFGFALSLISCTNSNMNNSFEENLQQNVGENEELEETKIIENAISPEEEKANNLAGTCPRGMHCLAPSCPLWKDYNSDNLCDRG